jgi:HD-GYP domain-containing protein (c-di-GMP phosphodiesterase class II)
MRILPVARVTPGAVLAESVYSSQDGVRTALLRSGVSLTGEMLSALERSGVFAVYVEDALSEGIIPPTPITEEMRQETVVALTDVFSTAKDGRTTKVPAGQVVQLEGMVQKILGQVQDSGEMASFLGDLGSFDTYTLSHSVNVCVLGLMIGEALLNRDGWRDYRGERRTDDIQSRLEELGIGLLLHDIGKVVVPKDVLNKPSRLTDDEMDLMRQHPSAGSALVGGAAISPLARAVILGHHERWDGKGYPSGKVGEETHVNARIAAIADVYDAVSSDRVYRTHRPSHEAFELVIRSAGTAFDPDLVRIFSRVVAPYPVGTAVVLSNGERGLITVNHPEHCVRPTIRVTHDAEGHLLPSPRETHLIDAPDIAIVDSMDDPGDDTGVPVELRPVAPEVMADHMVGEPIGAAA